MMPAELEIPLAAAIRALRRELVEAVHEGEGEEVRFALGPVELDLQITLSREAGAEGKIAFWVVALGGKGMRTSTTTHTLHLKLSPVRSDLSGPLIVGSEQAERPE
jgi:Trypsin-co-occurring domain 2